MSHGHDSLHYHEGLLDQEVIIMRIFYAVLIAFLIVALLIESYHVGLFASASLSTGFAVLVWGVIKQVWTAWIAPLFIVLNVICFGIFLFSLIKSWPLRDHQKLRVWSLKPHHAHASGHGHETGHKEKNPLILKHWTSIVKKANTGVPENLRSAIVESDALVDLFLRQSGFSGDTMADRLSQISKDRVKSLDRLWDAHRLRNEIAHTPGFVVSVPQAEKALMAFRDFLKEMEAF